MTKRRLRGIARGAVRIDADMPFSFEKMHSATPYESGGERAFAKGLSDPHGLEPISALREVVRIAAPFPGSRRACSPGRWQPVRSFAQRRNTCPEADVRGSRRANTVRFRDKSRPNWHVSTRRFRGEDSRDTAISTKDMIDRTSVWGAGVGGVENRR